MYLTSLTSAKSLRKVNIKKQDFKRVLELNCSKRRTEQFNFFNWLLNVKNLVLSNSSEHVRNVIQWHLNSFFLQKITKTCRAARGSAAGPSYVRRLSYISLLNTSPTLNIFAF